MNIGDQVKIRKDCTIAELMENKWNRACKDTTEFLRYADLEDTYTVKDISKRGNVVIEGVTDEDLFVNPNLLEVVATTGGSYDDIFDLLKELVDKLTQLK